MQQCGRRRGGAKAEKFPKSVNSEKASGATALPSRLTAIMLAERISRLVYRG